MSNARAQRVIQTLGMPQGTAMNRLRKMVLFRQLKKYNDNICTRCEKEIETVNELSIEHIKPWEGRSAELFWDMDNISFSHLRCNIAHTFHGGIARRRIPPDGMAWCVMCKKFEPRENFHNGSRWDGLQQWCKYNRRDR
jgi:hypothetical protein